MHEVGVLDCTSPARLAVISLASVFSACSDPSNLTPRLSSGDYAFVHKFTEAEHAVLPEIELRARIQGRHIVLTNDHDAAVFPAGVVAEGTLLWHAASAQWIIGTDSADANAAEVGGCSGGPEVVDLERRIYWTC